MPTVPTQPVAFLLFVELFRSRFLLVPIHLGLVTFFTQFVAIFLEELIVPTFMNLQIVREQVMPIWVAKLLVPTFLMKLVVPIPSDNPRGLRTRRP